MGIHASLQGDCVEHQVYCSCHFYAQNYDYLHLYYCHSFMLNCLFKEDAPRQQQQFKELNTAFLQDNQYYYCYYQ